MKDAMFSAFYVPVFLLWTFSAPIGTVYWIYQDSAIDTALSLIIPGYGAGSTVFDLAFGRSTGPIYY